VVAGLVEKPDVALSAARLGRIRLRDGTPSVASSLLTWKRTVRSVTTSCAGSANADAESGEPARGRLLGPLARPDRRTGDALEGRVGSDRGRYRGRDLAGGRGPRRQAGAALAAERGRLRLRTTAARPA